ncbi:uncharacterized protein LOC109084986 isoform X3 [Cyprinus carpio]|uniref:Uncharacterized protein LOC109084986 isoform X3 n=1 Tax=Cyprinus carpio TaxID=7962 RepID=A0A9Q9Y3H6_CYPCA|nr:uncharacterized protein LOC109084986 isoform X3 [Cyprinus carpio]
MFSLIQRVKQMKMEFIKEESEDLKIEDAVRVQQEEAEAQTGLMLLKEESEVQDEMEEKDHLWKVFLHKRKPKTPHGPSHWREALRLPAVWKVFH